MWFACYRAGDDTFYWCPKNNWVNNPAIAEPLPKAIAEKIVTDLKISAAGHYDYQASTLLKIDDFFVIPAAVSCQPIQLTLF